MMSDDGRPAEAPSPAPLDDATAPGVAAPAPVQRRPLVRLARFFQLVVWDDEHLLQGPVRASMGLAGLALLIVALFEAGAWWLFWSTTIGAGTATVGAVLLGVLAGFIALLFSIGVLIFDISMMTADTDPPDDAPTDAGPLQNALGAVLRYKFVAGRLLIIGASVFVTAQPMHTFMFRHDILKRQYEEAVLSEAVAQVTALELALERARDFSAAQAAADAASSGVQRRYDAAREASQAKSLEIAPLQQAEAALRADLDAATSRRDAARRAKQEVEAQPEPSPSAIRAADRRLGAAQRVLDAAASAHRAAVNELQLAQSGLDVLKAAEAESLAALNEKERDLLAERRAQRADAMGEVKRIDDWMDAARNLRPPRTLKAADGRRWPELSPSLNENLAVIDDLRFCRSALWPAGADAPLPARTMKLDKGQRDDPRIVMFAELREAGATRKEIAMAMFGLPDAASGCEAGSRDADRAGQYAYQYVVAYVIAAFVPFLALLAKLFLGYLPVYYSVRRQAAAGTTFARRLLEVDRR